MVYTVTYKEKYSRAVQGFDNFTEARMFGIAKLKEAALSLAECARVPASNLRFSEKQEVNAKGVLVHRITCRIPYYGRGARTRSVVIRGYTPQRAERDPAFSF